MAALKHWIENDEEAIEALGGRWRVVDLSEGECERRLRENRKARAMYRCRSIVERFQRWRVPCVVSIRPVAIFFSFICGKVPGQRHPSSYLSAACLPRRRCQLGPLGAWLLLHLALLAHAATPSDEGGKKPKARRKADVVKASAKKPTKKAVPAKVARVRIINATSRGRVGKLNGATRIKRIEWSPSRKITHKMLTAANPPPTAHGAALCISGELRSFAMPLVHNTIKRAADAWRADTFMVYHTDYDARAMTHPHRMGAQSCIYNESTLHYALHVLNPVATSRFNRKGVCSSERRGEFAKASIQFAQIAQCFELARRHEAKHDDVCTTNGGYVCVRTPLYSSR